jgi:hypothetical protein
MQLDAGYAGGVGEAVVNLDFERVARSRIA